MRQREDGAGGVSGWDWSGKRGGEAETLHGTQAKRGRGRWWWWWREGGGVGVPRKSRSLLFLLLGLLPRRAEGTGGERWAGRGREGVAASALESGGGRGSGRLGRARSGFSTRGRGWRVAAAGFAPRRWGARVGTRGGLREARPRGFDRSLGFGIWKTPWGWFRISAGIKERGCVGIPQ